jgi:predicted acyltransferase
MFLMVFVNDLWTLRNTPGWLKHSAAREDGMGLSDVVFPAFLFIVGLSIPFAIKSRLNKGDLKYYIFLHILIRSLALIVMGFFFVNHEYFQRDVSFFLRNAWEIAMVIAFVLIWNEYENNKAFKVIPAWILQSLGVLILITLALLYKGGTAANPQGMSPHWWGILGLIGWSYLFISVIYLLIGNRLWLASIFLVIFYILNVQEFSEIAGYKKFKLITSASNHALVMSGMFSSLIYLKLKNNKNIFLFPLVILLPAIFSAAFGFYTRPVWGISKILATPSWTAITAAISFTSFGLIYLITDILNHTRWAKPIMPAGRSTLTCYLLPVIIYALFHNQIRQLPASFTTGLAGIAKSVTFAFLIISLTWMLEKIKIKIKL